MKSVVKFKDFWQRHLTLKRILRLVRNLVFDLKYGEFLGGKVESPYASLGSLWTANTDYAALEHIFNNEISKEDVLLDVGCGKGRVLNWWVENYPNNKVYGIEWNDDIAQRVKKRLKRYQNVQIISGSVFDHYPRDANILYLFNPFQAELMEKFKEFILQMGGHSVTQKPIRLYYYYPKEIAFFEEDSRFLVRYPILPDQFHKLAIIEFAVHYL